MRAARSAALRLLYLAIAGTIVLPLVLFAYASWVDYRAAQQTADERIERSLEVVHEHASKVFEAVDLAFLQVAQLFRDIPDERIRADEQAFHLQLKAISDTAPEIHSIVLFDRDGRPLVSGLLYPVLRELSAADRDYFRAQIERDAGAHVGEILISRDPRLAADPFFTVSRRRSTPEGAFAGVVRIGVPPAEFERFYGQIGRVPGSQFSMLREDGRFLARYPPPADRSLRLDESSAFQRTISASRLGGVYISLSPVDGIERRIATRKLGNRPVYLNAGIETRVIRREWLSVMLGRLAFGLPATAIMAVSLALALARTRKLHDEADRREIAEAALRQAQRMEAIGQLTGGVAHDFNNLLTIVSGGVQRLLRRKRDAEDARYLDMIAGAAKRAENLTRQLLSFSRRQALAPQVIDLSRRIPQFRDLLNPSLRGDIELVIEVPRTPCPVKVDPAEFELAILNIAVNARDAMPSGGRLSIRVRPVTLAHGPEDLSGAFAEIAMTDTGRGIPAEALPRVFDPFFTTKEVGKGTGLGLSQVYGFAKQSGGAGTPGRGATVVLYLPLSGEPPSAEVRDKELHLAEHAGGTVLLVEDNEEVAAVCRSYLDQLGFAVEHAATAKQALAVLENDKPIELMFSDILMPGEMNGVELAREARRLRPKIPVVLTTGYSTSADAALREGFVVLRKPYDLESLRKMLFAAFGGTQAAAAAMH
ncbi:MAG: response regulator [Alphaproteobacteria bacterium]|nr:MAG: response regulator [Alphaproteobacteria bacterium]